MVKFTWHVAVGGYHWDGDEDWSYLEPADWRVRVYSPLEEYSGLFRTFAEVKRTKAGVLAFANRFGNLGAEFDPRDEVRDEIEPPGEYETVLGRKELLRRYEPELRTNDSWAVWESATERMRKCVGLWDDAQGRGADRQSMREVQTTINQELDGGQVRVAFEENPKLGGLALQLIPRSLLGALWVQFALAVEANKQYRRCGTCGLWFELAPEINRISRHYCSEACRSRAYRARKERARQLGSEGKTPEEIAAELDSDEKTVRGWLKNRKEEPNGA